MKVMPREAQSNPKLHDLYVRWAMKHLYIAKTAVTTLYDTSNLNAYDLAAPLAAAIKEKINTDPAYMEAAARLFAGEPVPADNEEI